MNLSISSSPYLPDEGNHPKLLSDVICHANPLTSIIYLDKQGLARHENYGSLLLDSKKILTGLQAFGARPKDKIIFQIENNEDILTCFWACQLGGFEPAIVPLTMSFAKENKALDQFYHLWRLFEEPLTITNAFVNQSIRQSTIYPDLQQARVCSIEFLRDNAPSENLYIADENDVALYSLSSGSTGISKAISLTHKNLISRGVGSNLHCKNTPQDIIFSWLPFDHIGNISAYHISPILMGSSLIYAPKEFILGKPLRWMDLIDQYRISHGWAPNFAFALVTKSLKSSGPKFWDLSCVKGLLSAGEVISQNTIEEFIEALRPYGLDSSSITSAFGMAEVCSGVSYHLPKPGTSIQFHHIDRKNLQGPIKRLSSNDPDSIAFANLGPAIPGIAMRIVDEHNQIVPEDTIGRFQLKGAPLSIGYYLNPEANKAFLEDGWFDTGDAGFISNQELTLIGRSGTGIIVNGVNLSNNEIEILIEQIPGICPSFTAACGVHSANNHGQKLAIFFSLEEALKPTPLDKIFKLIQGHLIQYLGTKADYLIPLPPESIPKTPIGKIQHKKLIQEFHQGKFNDLLSEIDIELNFAKDKAPKTVNNSGSSLEIALIKMWQDVLEISDVGIHDNFFELGGHSLLLVQLHERLLAIYPNLNIVDLFKYPSIQSMIEGMSLAKDQVPPHQKGVDRAKKRSEKLLNMSQDIAIIGMSCRFPGANDLESFWNNLVNGVESISTFSAEEVVAGGINKTLAEQSNYIKASPKIADIKGFDAEFFGYSAKESELMDPQHRIFLECAWEAFETAGYDPIAFQGVAGIYAGVAMNTYLMNQVLPNRHMLDVNDDLNITTLDSMGGFQLMVANDKDYLTTRVSYKLNLTGPSVNVQTACSTGLVAVHMACQSLQAGEADIFLAGASSIQVPENSGHLYQPGLIVSDDEHVRSFDANAKGTIFGSGVGCVLLKRFDEALADGDQIYAVIKGSAVNNDGGVKVGYMAPSSEGQSSVISQALHMANVPAESIGLVEAHGTGTEMGDPIEFNGLAQVFRSQTQEKEFCALGSVKTNVGHLQISSGIAGVIKTALSLHHQRIPPMLNFATANPGIDFPNSPFYINTQVNEWKTTKYPRRAGVSSLGIGGTNAHAIFEEAPARIKKVTKEISRDRSKQILLLSAKTNQALIDLVKKYQSFLLKNPNIDIGDLCFTANSGRHLFEHRLVLVESSIQEIQKSLESWLRHETNDQINHHHLSNSQKKNIAFLFTGQGSQFTNMGKQLFEKEPIFRETIENCANLIKPHLDIPLLDLLYPGEGKSSLIDQTRYAQPCLFAFEYSLAKLWMSWGIKPQYLLGHSLGEYVAACIAGVFSLEEGLYFVAERGRLMQNLPQIGEMWSINASVQDISPFVALYQESISLAVENSSTQVVISGNTKDLENCLVKIHEAGFKSQRLNTSHAFHSPLMDDVLADFMKLANQINFGKASIPIISNLTGELMPDDGFNTKYWTDHLRSAVQFFTGLQTLDSLVDIVIEVGPKPILLGIAAQTLSEDRLLLQSVNQLNANEETLANSLGKLACYRPIGWDQYHRHLDRSRLSLPTYPFQHKPYWIERPKNSEPESGLPISQISSLLLGKDTFIPALKTVVFESTLDPEEQEFLQHHQIYGQFVVSGAYHVVLMLDAAMHLKNQPQISLEEVYFSEPLVIERNTKAQVQLLLTQDEFQNYQANLTSMRKIDDKASPSSNDLSTYRTHAQALIKSHSRTSKVIDWDHLSKHCSEVISIENYLSLQSERRIELGASYQWFSMIQRSKFEAICEIEQPQNIGGLDPAQLHPGLLDACFGLLLACGILDQAKTWMPFTISAIHIHQKLEGISFLRGHLTLRSENLETSAIADVFLADAEGHVLIEFIGLEARPAEASSIEKYLTMPDQHLYYDRVWKKSNLPITPKKQDFDQRRIFFKDEMGFADRMTQLIASPKAIDVTVSIAQDFVKKSVQEFSFNPSNQNHWAQFFEVCDSQNLGFNEIYYFWPITPPKKEIPSHALDLSEQFLYFIQSLVRLEWSNKSKVLIFSNSAHKIASQEELIHPQYAPLYGASLSIAAEYPELNFHLIDLDPSKDCHQLDQFHDSNAQSQLSEIWHGYRDNSIYVTRLKKHNLLPINHQISCIHSNASYLVTGGTKGLGLEMVKQLISLGAKHIVVLGRNPVTDEVLKLFNHYQESGVEVVPVLCDVANNEQLSQCFEKIQSRLPALKGFVHCAGQLADGILAQQNRDTYAKAFSAKAQGAWNLHVASKSLELDFFVLFSSAASILGNQGQSNYSAANAFLDQLAHLRHQEHLPAISINWGPWDEIGMAQEVFNRKDHLARQGFKSLSPKFGGMAFERAISHLDPQLIAIEWDWQRYSDNSEHANFLFEDLKNQIIQNNKEVVQDLSVIEPLYLFENLSSEERYSFVEKMVTQEVVKILGISDLTASDYLKPLTDQGLDSLQAVQLRNALNKLTAQNLPVSLAFNYPNIESLIQFILEILEKALLAEKKSNNLVLEEKTISIGQTAEALLADFENLLD
jgi:myxalamid-type polyketide synthase MxaB